ncbi:MAG: 16S rRNA (cytosine(967)-C(5))-methyltransferase RsmB [Clostridiales bacterium]|jgi:16S rRNA (cytosine967-C5)-methyltransferase|nr:16S rRNA (cytosine(967)-C(5))-methyltransferase RsmB [Clostridiales bacterium]
MSLRREALNALVNITDHGAYANLRLKKASENLSRQDAKWLAAAVYGVLDHLLYIDYMLAHFTKGRQKPMVRGILRMGAHELLFMHVPEAVACNECVNLIKEIGKGALSGYVNGVMRAMARAKDHLPALPQEPVERLSIKYSWPQWLVREWVERFGEADAERLLKRRPVGISIRAQYPYTAARLQQTLDVRGIAFSRGTLDDACFHLQEGMHILDEPLYKNGSITVQGEGAMLACRACAVRTGTRVLDACAAPGGKTAYLYALARGKADITALEYHAHRVRLLQSTLNRLGARADIRRQDATVFVEDFCEAFDVVLLDVPCSGLGVTGAKPDIRYVKTRRDIEGLCALQQKLLNTCARYVKTGGALIYASCTISFDENELQVEGFLSRHPGFALEDLSPYFSMRDEMLKQGTIQLLPCKHHTEGFFIARLRKK